MAKKPARLRKRPHPSQKEAAQILGVTARTLRNWIKKGTAPQFVRASARHHQFDPKAIAAWKRANTVRGKKK